MRQRKEPPRSISQKPPAQRTRGTNARTRVGKVIPLVLLAGVILTALLLSQFTATKEVPPPVLTVTENGVQRAVFAEVLNASGERRVAVKITDYLRGKGVDVKDFGTFNDSLMARTYVIDRTGNIEAARGVAQLLGVSGERILSRPNPRLLVDVTVLVGKDHPALTEPQP